MKKKLLCVLLALVVAVGLFAGGSSSSGSSGDWWKVSRANFRSQAFGKRPPAAAGYTISILTISQDGTFIAPDHPAIKALEDLTGYKVKLEYVLNANYSEAMNTRIASRDLPGLVAITSNTMPIVTAAQYGGFWDITDVYDLYPNLARADKGIMNNVSIEGRYFGIYRSRDYPRTGMIYRTDWLENLGLSVPKNLDELYNVLRAFTYNDPDKNGRDDTFGMNWCAYLGPFYTIAVMHGAPNRFGDKNGKLTPWFEWDEFYEAMVYSKRLYDEKIINQDFAVVQGGDWALPFGRGQAGWHIDVADEASRSATRLRDNGLMTQADFDAGKYVGVMGPVANKSGKTFVWPQNDGHQGYTAISTSGAKTMQELAYYLDFMDKCNSATGISILNWGIENVNYTKNSDGTITTIPAAQIPNNWGNLQGMNQFRMLNDLGPIQKPNAYQAKHQQVLKEITPFAVPNPVTPIALMSPTWTARQSSLNQIVDDAVINFVMGRIDRAGFDREKARWYSDDGQKALDELQKAYNAKK
jgi:putative aldouronate transport system substrate-binding protein